MNDVDRWARWHDRSRSWADWELVSSAPTLPAPVDRFTREGADGRTEHELAWARLRESMSLSAFVPWEDALRHRSFNDGPELGALSLEAQG